METESILDIFKQLAVFSCERANEQNLKAHRRSEISPQDTHPGPDLDSPPLAQSSHNNQARTLYYSRSGYHQMSEIEQASEEKHITPIDAGNVEVPQQSQEQPEVSEDTQPLVNGTRSPAQATPTAAPPPVKRFSSANISKKFLQKTSSALNSTNSLSTANSSASSPAPTKAAPNTGQSRITRLYKCFVCLYGIFSAVFVTLISSSEQARL